MPPFSTVRLTLLRACYLLLVVGLAFRAWPTLFTDIATQPRMDGVVIAFLSAMGFVAVIGLFSPVRMLPLLVFEIAWKSIWVLAVAVPNLLANTLDDGMGAILFACGWVLPFVIIVPWRYVARTYFASAEPARAPVTQ